jgi:hypothetical protein
MYIQRSKLSGDQTNVHKSQARNNWNKGHERFTKLLDSSCRSWTLLVLWSVHFYWRTDGQAHANRKRVTFVRQKLTSQVRIVTRYIRNDIDDSRHINSGAYYYCNQHPQAVCLCRKICSAECVCMRACVRVRVYACVRACPIQQWRHHRALDILRGMGFPRVGCLRFLATAPVWDFPERCIFPLS